MSYSNAEKRRVLKVIIERGRLAYIFKFSLSTIFLMLFLNFLPLIGAILLPFYIGLNVFHLYMLCNDVNDLKNDDLSMIDDELVKMYRGEKVAQKNTNPYREGRVAWLRSIFGKVPR